VKTIALKIEAEQIMEIGPVDPWKFIGGEFLFDIILIKIPNEL